MKALFVPVAVVLAALTTAGCPVPVDPQLDYDAGFLDGFDQDDYYWTWGGYFDSWDTLDDAPVYYKGDTIPDVEDPPYESGYNDGLWYAYHDGYYVSYKYSFIIGFSEGYDNAYWPDYLAFLDADQHLEYRNGGFGDGYMDGYSEGRVFGAYDYEVDIDFDWLGALLDYEDGVDLYFEEIDVGTGEYGPVILYEHGQNPFDLKRAARKSPVDWRKIPSIRRTAEDKAIDPATLELYRPIIQAAQQELNVSPAESLRDPAELLLTDTWLDRVEEYLDVAAKTRDVTKSLRTGPRVATAPAAP
jgi:hypothetical protein